MLVLLSTLLLEFVLAVVGVRPCCCFCCCLLLLALLFRRSVVVIMLLFFVLVAAAVFGALRPAGTHYGCRCS